MVKSNNNTKVREKKGLTGKVISTKMQKTVIVEVISIKRHALYKKAMRRSKSYSVHCELPGVHEGDLVRILASKPMSKTKNYRVTEKISK